MRLLAEVRDRASARPRKEPVTRGGKGKPAEEKHSEVLQILPKSFRTQPWMADAIYRLAMRRRQSVADTLRDLLAAGLQAADPTLCIKTHCPA